MYLLMFLNMATFQIECPYPPGDDTIIAEQARLFALVCRMQSYTVCPNVIIVQCVLDDRGFVYKAPDAEPGILRRSGRWEAAN